MTKTHAPKGVLLVLASLVFINACQRNKPEYGMTSGQSVNSYIEQSLNDYFATHPDFAVRAGRHEFDGKLPDWSAEGYTMGKLMIKKLREDWTNSRSGKQAWQSFHDEFLKYGGPPIPLVRKAMLPGETGSLF